MRNHLSASVEELTTTLDTILDTVTDHAHWQLFRGYNGYRITLFLDADFLNAAHTKDASGTVYLENPKPSPTLAKALTSVIDVLLDTIDDFYNGVGQVAA